jgi:hypothetical protein
MMGKEEGREEVGVWEGKKVNPVGLWVIFTGGQ